MAQDSAAQNEAAPDSVLQYSVDAARVTTEALAATEGDASTATAASFAGLVPAFAATSFLSAALLFSIQPLFAKMVLPVLGGAPAVWAVAVCYFQIALLVGYLYAHLLKTYVSLELTGWTHLALCVLSLAALPIGIPAHWSEPPFGDPTLWQLTLFTFGIGLPFVTVAANAPLLQAWFAATRHPAAANPYFLYAASNLGSFAALLGYPFILEPTFGLTVLSRAWTVGFLGLAVCVAGLVNLTLRHAAIDPAASPRASAAVGPAPAWASRAHWVWLALIPSALLTAFTTHIATDIASAPLLWVIPLAMYLLTFVLVFRTRALVPRAVMLPLHAVAVTAALLVLSQGWHTTWWLTAPVGALAFMTATLVSHRTLYEQRPPAAHLTEFYLWMSLGGALGGLAAALLAPNIFAEVYEYPLLLALTFACRPDALRFGSKWIDQLLALFLIAVLAGLAIYWVPIWLTEMHQPSRFAAITAWGPGPLVAALMAIVVVACWRHPMSQLAAALGMCAAVALLPSMVRKGAAQRSYFGVYRVLPSEDGEFNTLVHGSTLHGAQRVRDADGTSIDDLRPATYYYDQGPMARTIAARRLALNAAGRKGRYGVVGLGAGSLACYARPGEAWRFFEIDPVIVGIARDEYYFTYLANCLPRTDIKLGDARLALGKEKDAAFDLLIIDAFSSDAVPVHLMTAEALKLYLAKLTPDGVVLLHISNRYLDLDHVLGATAAVVPGIHGFLLTDTVQNPDYAHSTSTVAVFAKTEAALDGYRKLAQLKPLDASKMSPWTDDYSDILRPLLSNFRRGSAG